MALRKLVIFDTVEGYSTEVVGSDDYDAQSRKISNLASPTLGTDAANKNYVDAAITGLDWKQSSRLATAAALPAYTASGSGVGKTLTANANGALSVDGVAVAVGNRVLVKDQAASHVDHGIYVVTATGDGSNPFILTRATDFDTNAEVTSGAATFIEEGSTNADTGWVLTTNDPITVDTTALAFAKFSSTVTYTFDQGLVETAGSVKVDLDTGAGAQTAGAGGGSSGLEFDVNTAAGKLRAAVHATGGIERSASGLAAKLNGVSLSSSASGLKVDGAPRVTTDATDNLFTADGTGIDAGDAVYVSASNVISQGDASNDTKSRVIGVCPAAIGAGAQGRIVHVGVAAGVLSGATAGTPYYLGTTGQPILYASLASNNRVIQLGFAKNATDLWVDLKDLGKKA